MTLRAVITGMGAYLPERIVLNSEFEKTLDTSDAWIQERTGIKQRHFAADDQYTSDLAIAAGKEAIESAGIEPSSIDLVIVATTTPDETMPSTATKVQHGLGVSSGAAFDINAACSGFVYAMTTANNFIISGSARRVLVIGAETYSRIMNWDDRGTCILFGDGAAAVVLDVADGSGKNSDRGVLHSAVYSDGQYGGLLATTGGVSMTQSAGTLFMSGKDIFRHAVSKMPDAVRKGLDALSLTIDDIDWLAPHQANQRILNSVGQKLGASHDQLINCVAGHANTSAASIPLALYTALQDGRLKKTDLVACPALGAGLTWGCTIFRL